MQLQAGQNTGLSQTRLTARISFNPTSTPLVLDASAYLLTASGKVQDDSGMAFYGQPSVAGGAVVCDAQARSFALDLARLPAHIDKVALTLTIEQAKARRQSFGQLSEVTLTLDGDAEPHRFTLACAGMSEAAVILGECYRREGAWKFRALGQGFNGGLGPLARHFGVEISDDPETTAAPAPAPAPIPPPPPPPPAPPISLNKITLEKRQPISLEKPRSGFGEMLVNLNWTRQTEGNAKGKAGGWGGLFGKGGSGAIDLDLGCMVELADGSKGVVQALGNTFGRFDTAPYMQLMGDDRTGAASDGENLRINGAHWDKVRRLVVYAYIYEGTPNWAAANAVVTIKAPGQPELTVHLDSHSDRETMCAIALIDNDGGRIRVTKLVDYYQGHAQLDEAHGFGFRWKAGSK